MGEAKRRANEIAKFKAQQSRWLANLTPAEKVILQLSQRLEERLVRAQGFTEGCYHLAFFMTRYLADKGVVVTPIIGWVNDGTWDGVASHAWVEYEGRITDVSMTRTSHPEQQPPGSMIVLDQILKKGRAEYTYYKNDDHRALKAAAIQRFDPQLGPIQAQKDVHHRQMLKIAELGHLERIDDYLAGAPSGLQFNDLKQLVE